MNNKKKIIRTLRNADKASVEKLLAEEAKKNEIFAKAQQRANIEQSRYADSISGVEKYERRISMTRIASIAAAAVLVIGSIGGGAYMIRNNIGDPVNPGPVEPATTVSAGTDTTTSNTASETTAAENTVSGEDSQQFSVTKEELIEKAKDHNTAYHFDRFSADYTFTVYESTEWQKDPHMHIGKIYIDVINLSASRTEEQYVNDKLVSRWLFAIKDGQEINGDEYWAETDYVNGGYKFLETPDRSYYTDILTDNEIIDRMPSGRNMAIDINAPDNWEITGERTENGRKIISISGFRKDNNNLEGVYREYTYTGEIDAATGMTISYDEHDNEGNKTYSYKMTNYKFDDDAVEFRTASDIISEIENGGYTKR